MKKYLFFFFFTAFVLSINAQDWQYCQVTTYAAGKKVKTIAQMDTITPPQGIESDKTQKFDSNTVWLNKFGQDGWELVSAATPITNSGTTGLYTFKRKLKE